MKLHIFRAKPLCLDVSTGGSVPKVFETCFDLVAGGVLILCQRIFVKNKKLVENPTFADHCSICAHPPLSLGQYISWPTQGTGKHAIVSTKSGFSPGRKIYVELF